MIEIKKVISKKDQKAFVTFPFSLYKDNKYYVPPLIGDEYKIFTKKGDYSDVTNSVFFLAYKDGKVVGRIHGIEQLQYNEIHNVHQIRFTRFDSIDDQEVANALFDAVVNWGKEKNMDSLVGPLGFSDLEREGLLIEGFEEKQTYAEQYNYEYYQKLIENYGFEKDIDWLEFNLTRKTDLDPKLFLASEKILKINKLHIVPINNISKHKYFKKYASKFFELLDVSYKKLYGVVPISKRVEKSLIQTLGLLIPKDFFRVIVDKDDKLVAFGLFMPNISDCLIKSKGRITPRFIIDVLKTIKNPKMADFLLVGVHPDYINKGITGTFLNIIYPLFDKGIESFETNLNLEYNYEILNCWRYFNSRQHKRRRCFKKKI